MRGRGRLAERCPDGLHLGDLGAVGLGLGGLEPTLDLGPLFGGKLAEGVGRELGGGLLLGSDGHPVEAVAEESAEALVGSLGLSRSLGSVMRPAGGSVVGIVVAGHRVTSWVCGRRGCGRSASRLRTSGWARSFVRPRWASTRTFPSWRPVISPICR